jgi:hypothetical protein
MIVLMTNALIELMIKYDFFSLIKSHKITEELCLLRYKAVQSVEDQTTFQWSMSLRLQVEEYANQETTL